MRQSNQKEFDRLPSNRQGSVQMKGKKNKRNSIEKIIMLSLT